MAAKYQRRLTWWVRFYHPRSGELIRVSLDTHDEAKAELLRQRIELETALLAPRFQAADIPADILTALGLPGRADNRNVVAAVATPLSPAPARPPQSVAPRQPLDRALQMYMAHIRSDNAALHVENKVSILRHFLGDERVATALGFKKASGKPGEGAFFKGEFLDEITPALLQEFMASLPVSTKTERHYQEFFHHFFEFNLKFGYFQPVNWHCPNPVAALPSYVKKNRHIVFLTATQGKEQLRVLEPHPVIHLAVAIMIFAGLRRAETLWLAPSHVASDLSNLSVVNRVDPDEDIESSQQPARIQRLACCSTAVQGGRSLGSIRQGQPARTNQRRAVNNSRRGCVRCGASSFIKVKYGATKSHAPSVTSLGYAWRLMAAQPTLSPAQS